MIAGIDIGASTTDAVLLTEREMLSASVASSVPVVAASEALSRLLEQCAGASLRPERLAVTGAGAGSMPEELLGFRLERVDEFTAVGLGGCALAGLDEALVVSMGTGTAMVSVRRPEVRHVGGTGVGGGTLLGLARQMLGVDDIETLQALAVHGDLTRVNLSIADIADGRALGQLPPDATAANFGKLHAVPTAEDKALGIIDLVLEVIAVLALAQARAQSHKEIVLTGKVTRMVAFARRFPHLERLFGAGFIVPKFADYATAIGAARALR